MKQGVDTKEIARLFQDRYGLMIAVARRYAPSSDLIYDIVQQSFIDFVEEAMKGRRDWQQDVTPYLYQVTKNRALKCWREHNKKMPATLRLIAERLAREPDRPEPEKIPLLRRCMEKLSRQSRELIESHYCRNVSMEEIAVQKERKTTTIRSIFCRIRQKLRECIEQNSKKSEG